MNSIFAASCVMQSLTKFHWVVSKLPALLMDTINALGDKPTADPYTELQNILLQSYGLSATKKTTLLLTTQA